MSYRAPFKPPPSKKCWCGSGRKAKNCHGIGSSPFTSKQPVGRPAPKEPPPEVIQAAMLEYHRQQMEDAQRKATFGEIRPQISTVFQEHRFIVVGNRVYYDKNWKFFPDFLLGYVPSVFGKEWGEKELAKPEGERHPLVQWRVEAIKYMNAQPRKPDGTYEAAPNGFLAAYMAFAYDLYVIQDNGRLDDLLLERLKSAEHFQGARHELFAEATCLRAGFTVEHEDERDRKTRHAEFTATHKVTGQKVSVEAKSKHRPGVLGRPGAQQQPAAVRLRFGELLNDAIAKNPPHPLVVFIDTNLPSRAADKFYFVRPGEDPPVSRLMVGLLNRVDKEHGEQRPYNLLVFTNHPHHYAAPDELDPKRHHVSFVPKTPAKAANMEALWAIANGANLYGNVPNEFPAERNTK